MTRERILIVEDERAVARGLGLAIVDSIVRAHDGCVAAESTRGEGSAFTIRLPQA